MDDEILGSEFVVVWEQGWWKVVNAYTGIVQYTCQGYYEAQMYVGLLELHLAQRTEATYGRP